MKERCPFFEVLKIVINSEMIGVDQLEESAFRKKACCMHPLSKHRVDIISPPAVCGGDLEKCEVKGAILEKKERKAAREGILANFQFYINDESNELFEGMTINTSPEGLAFLTALDVKEGVTITITEIMAKSALADFVGRKAEVIWVKKRRQYVEAGAKIIQTI